MGKGGAYQLLPPIMTSIDRKEEGLTPPPYLFAHLPHRTPIGGLWACRGMQYNASVAGGSTVVSYYGLGGVYNPRQDVKLILIVVAAAALRGAGWAWSANVKML